MRKEKSEPGCSADQEMFGVAVGGSVSDREKRLLIKENYDFL